MTNEPLPQRFGSPVTQDAGTVTVISVAGPRARIESRRWVSGTMIRFANGSVVQVTDVGPLDTGALIVEGEVRAGDRLRVLEMSIKIAPLTVGGRMPPELLRALGALGPEVPIRVFEAPTPRLPDLTFNMRHEGLELTSRDGSHLGWFRIEEGYESTAVGRLLQEVVFRQLSALDNPLSPFEVVASVEGSGRARIEFGSAARIAVGDDLRVRLWSGESGYLTLLNMAPDGSMSLLVPNEEGVVYLSRGVPVRVPREGSELTFKVGYPTGIGVLRALVTPSPLTLSLPASAADASGIRTFFAELGTQLGVSLGSMSIRITPVSGMNWASRLAYYEIFDPY